MSYTLPYRSNLRWASFAALASSLLLLAGCGTDATAPDGNSFIPNATISGNVMGGQQPVVGATIDLYAVGTAGYGSGAVRLAETTTGSGGSFQFSQVSTQNGASATLDATYGCPSNSTLLYLVSSGGDPSGVGSAENFNTNIKLLDAIGQCSTVKSQHYNIDEVVTVASAAALQQYIDPVGEQIGSPAVTGSGSSQAAALTGIANAFAMVPNLVNLQNGTANATFSPTSSVGTVTATVEAAKINTIADVIAACVNTTGSGSSACTTLEAAATPPTVGTATNFSTSYNPTPTAGDTLQAVLFMLQNPTDAGTQISSCSFDSSQTTNLGCLYAAQTASAPFAGLNAVPNDWSIGVTYASNSTTTVSGNTVGVLNSPAYLAVDKSGDVWVANTAAAGTGASLVELSPQGGAINQVLASGQLTGPQGLALDPSGNLWVANFGSSTAGYGTTVVEYPATGSPAAGNSFNVGGCPYGVASDGIGDIFVGECSVTGSGSGNTAAGSDVREIQASAVSGSTALPISTAATSYAGTQGSAIAVDSNYDVWTTTGTASVFSFTPTTTGGVTTYSSYLTNTSAVTDSASLSINNANDVWVGNYAATGAGTLSELSISGGAIVASSGSPFSGNNGLDQVASSVTDGAGNTWITDNAGSGHVSEFASTGGSLTPATGLAHQFTAPTGIAVDPSGNVWVGNTASDTTAAVSGYAAAGGYVTEIVGAAVPVVTPIAAGLPATPGGTSYLGTTPQ